MLTQPIRIGSPLSLQKECNCPNVLWWFCLVHLFPGISDFPGNFLSDATLGTAGDVSLQAVSWILFVTFGMASQVVAFHRSHCDGLNLHSGSTTRCMISGNQLLSGQKGVIMVRSPPYFTRLLRAIWMMFGGGKAYLRPSGHLSSEALSLDVPLPERSRLKYWGSL